MLSLGSLGPLKTPNRLTPVSLAAGAAIAYVLHALDHPEPDLTPQWVTHAALVPLHQPAAQNEPRNTRKANSGRATPRSRAPATSRRRLLSNPHPGPFDGDPTAIRDSEPSQIPSVMVSADDFAKEPSVFSVINPPSSRVQKYLHVGPVFNVLAPELFPFRTRSPVPDFCTLALESRV